MSPVAQEPERPVAAEKAVSRSAPPVAQPSGDDESAVRRLWNVFRHEPMLMVTVGYLFVSIVGLWDSYWFYRRFDVPILEYMQSSDYFVAGLRRPDYLILLATTILASALALWPERWRRRNPDRAERLQARWWGRLLVPRRKDWWAYFGMHPETSVVLMALLVMAAVLFVHSNLRATNIHDGRLNGVEVRLYGQTEPVAGQWQMLGTSSAFVFLWNPAQTRAQVVPIQSIASLVPKPVAGDARPQPVEAEDSAREDAGPE